MADNDVGSGDGPSLELPSLGLRGLRRKSRAPQGADLHGPETEGDPVPESDPKRKLPGIASAALTGTVAGLLLVGAVKLALRGCDTLRGTDSCGGPGFFLLVAILIVLMVLATRILRLLGRQDAGTVATLGVGMAAVIALGLLSGHLLSPWMLLVMPALSVVTFVVGHWLSTTVSTETR
jgi:hypothetical protein